MPLLDYTLIKKEQLKGCLYDKEVFAELGIEEEFVQDNLSFSEAKGTLRGLHFQAPPLAQAKLIRCSRGCIYDVAVDIRKGSPTYGQWVGYELSAECGDQIYVPIGFAHGFITLEPYTEVAYKCSSNFSPDAEGSIHWNSCGITWPVSGKIVISEKDNVAQKIEDFESPFSYHV
ncbi:dTDP-4-dehydrorhamnose 3,5-epimerase [Rhodobacterales bacterium HKCCA1288]|nr:dTDP-4-dehydrorhamnose 3,5-epimerase [Rhodobacterales bacterium HKCCA1288]